MSIDPLSPSQPAADDWPAKASATIVQYVGTVRDKTTGPALKASRYAVYSIPILLIALMLAVLSLVLLVRLLVTATALLPFVDDGETWMAYYILGAIFALGGTILWRKKEP